MQGLKWWRSGLLAICLLIFATSVYAQRYAFSFLDIPANTKLGALGGVNISSGGDVNQFLSNPALLDDSLATYASFNYINFPGDISLSQVTYAHQISGFTVGFGLQYMDYGEIESFDDTGFPLGVQDAREYAFTVGLSKSQGVFDYGINTKLISARYADAVAIGLAFDIGLLFQHPEYDLVGAINIRNIGFMLKDFTEIANSELPLDVVMGASFKPEYMPIRFSLTARNLGRQEATYFDPSRQNNLASTAPSFGAQVMNRLIFGAEVLLSENFHLRGGYNHLVRRELLIEQAGGGSGFSFGLMFRVKSFEFAYTRALYHTAGSANLFSISTQMKRFWTHN